MTKPLSPIHAPLDPDNPAATIVLPSRISRLAQLDSHVLSGRQHSLGPGGASAMFTQAVQRALIEEMTAQLRGDDGSMSEIGAWADEIIAAFREG